MLTAKQSQQYIDQLETMRTEIKAHYISIEDERSIYNYVSLRHIGKALDGITDAIDGLRGE